MDGKNLFFFCRGLFHELRHAFSAGDGIMLFYGNIEAAITFILMQLDKKIKRRRMRHAIRDE